MKESRNRVIYQSESIYVSDDVLSTSNLNHCELIRIQTSDYGFTMNKTDVNQYGLVARIDSILDLPTVNFDLSYYLSDGFNEKALGFNIDESYQFAKKHIENNGGFNFYVITSKEGSDSASLEFGDDISIIGVGNAYINNYSVDLSVGSLPTVNISCEGSNINSLNTVVSGEGFWGTDIFADIASIDMETAKPNESIASLFPPFNTGDNGPTALRPGDITLQFQGFGDQTNGEAISKISGDGSFHLQSANLSLPMPREELRRLGTKGIFARVMEYPIRANLSVNAILSNIETANLAEYVRGCDEPGLNNNISISATDCEKNNAITWTLIKPLLVSESFSSNIGPNKSVDLVFEVEIGDIEDISVGLICNAEAKNRGKVIPVNDNAPTRLYGYGGYSGDAELASGVFTGPDNLLLEYTFDDPIQNNWRQNTAIAPPFGSIYGPWDNVRTVSFGGSLETIGSYSFEHLEITGQLYIPSNVTSMGSYAFQNCTGLTSLVIDGDLFDIPNGAFKNCDNIISVTRN
tara:strand:+ start:15140 stop:16702 length:1563 start_codon:yes stop_codon:yes gene_type:complete